MAKEKKEKVRSMTSAEVIIATMPPRGHVEIRERQDKTFRVFYSDEGFIPCAPVCRLGEYTKSHKHDYTQKMVESYYIPVSEDDAIDYAERLAEGREVKMLRFKTINERNKEARERKATEKEIDPMKALGHSESSSVTQKAVKRTNKMIKDSGRKGATVSTEGTFKRKDADV